MEDRTAEFRSLAQLLPPPADHTKSSLEATTTTAASYAELRQFHQTAAEISQDIAATSALLKELTQLVRNQSILQNDNYRVNQLVVRIKSSIENLNARLDQAGRTIAQQKRKLSNQAGQEASNLVDGLKTEFAQAANGFKQILEQRTDGIRECDQLQRQVYMSDTDIPNVASLAPPPVYGQRQQQFSLDLTSNLMETGQDTNSLPRPHGISDDGIRQRRTDTGVPIYSGAYSTYSSPAPLTPLDIQRMEEESNQTMALIPDQDYLQQRADAMEQVESNIQELGAVFNKLAVMIGEHRDMVQRVEDNTQDANTNLTLSMNTLTDTLENLKTNRQLLLRIFSIFVIFIIVFIVFFA